MKNKKGQMDIGKLFLFIAIAFAFVIIMAIIMYFVHTIQSALLPVAQQTLDRSGSNASSMSAYNGTVGSLTEGYAPMQWAVIAIIFSLLISILISCMLAKNHPVVLIPYSLIVIVAVIFSVGISNEYEKIALDPTIGGELSGFLGVSWFFNYLPIIICVVGLIGGLLIVLNMNRGVESNY